jgi:hypothetical protein
MVTLPRREWFRNLPLISLTVFVETGFYGEGEEFEIFSVFFTLRCVGVCA